MLQHVMQAVGNRLSRCEHVIPAQRRYARQMKPIAMIGIVLIVLGLAALAYQGINYTSRETVIDIGPIHATADRDKRIPLPPVFGIVAVAGGVALLMAGFRRQT